MSRSPPCRNTLIQTEEMIGRRAGYIERCKSGSEGGTRHTYWVNGPYPTERRVGGGPGSFWTVYGREHLVAAFGSEAGVASDPLVSRSVPAPWHKICSFIIMRVAGVAGDIIWPTPATYASWAGPARVAGHSCFAGPAGGVCDSSPSQDCSGGCVRCRP
jgi:hypothetical protein